MSRLQTVTVLGGGVLGSQIAWHSAFKGKHVVVYDIAEEALARCEEFHRNHRDIYREAFGSSDSELTETARRLTYTTDLATAVSDRDLVIEAVPEVHEIKSVVYEQMSSLLDTRTVVVTNSSTFLAREFAELTGRPEKYCALHFANTIWIKNLVEIMGHPGVSPQTLTEVTEFAIEIGMIPIPVYKEQNGYVINTWFVALLNAAQTLVTNGVCTPEDVDRTFMLTQDGAKRGPMGAFDTVGMRTAYNVLMHWGSVENDPQKIANAEYIKTNFIDKGKLGIESGEGYYTYPNPAYASADFFRMPEISEAAEIALRIQL